MNKAVGLKNEKFQMSPRTPDAHLHQHKPARPMTRSPRARSRTSISMVEIAWTGHLSDLAVPIDTNLGPGPGPDPSDLACFAECRAKCQIEVSSC